MIYFAEELKFMSVENQNISWIISIIIDSEYNFIICSLFVTYKEFSDLKFYSRFSVNRLITAHLFNAKAKGCRLVIAERPRKL